MNKTLRRAKQFGITTIEVEYSGEGDSGAIDYTKLNYVTVDAKKRIQPKLEKALLNEIEDIIWDEILESKIPSGWECDSGASGDVTIDLRGDEQAPVSIEHRTNYTDTTTETYSMEL